MAWGKQNQGIKSGSGGGNGSDVIIRRNMYLCFSHTQF